METTSPSERPGPQRYRVLAVEPDERLRTRMTLELAGIVPAPLTSIDEVTRELVPGEPTVVVFGPSLADADGLAAVQRITRSFPEVGVVLLAEELTLPLLQDALRAGVRDALTIDAGERQIRLAVERVGETMSGVVDRAPRPSAEPARLGQDLRRLLHQGRRRQERRRHEPRGAARDAQPGPRRARRRRPPVRRRRGAARRPAAAHVGRRGRRGRDHRHAADGRLPRDARGVVAARAVRAGRAGRGRARSPPKR